MNLRIRTGVEFSLAFEQRGWLSEQPPAFQQRIAALARVVRVRRGEWVFQVNDQPGGIYGVVWGGIGVEGSSPYSCSRLGHVLRSGSWFGHGPILSGGGMRVQSMRALEETELAYVPLAPLQALVNDNPIVATYLGNMANGGSMLGTRVISDLLIPSVPQRIAAVLLRITGAEEGVEPHHPDGFMITQAELGEMANVSRANVNRVLGEFARRNWIAKRFRRLRICDVGALRSFAASIM
jgi:CRP/FNR family transcriptional regulator, cyclic AMP receptor protein